MNVLAIRSYAKLNLYLKVLNKRKDNYHNILTLFERISLYDEIFLNSRLDNKIRIISDCPGLLLGKENLAYRAASLLKKELKIKKGIDIKIKKNIPLASGLGGGSSNAAALLSGLNRFWNLGISDRRLISFGRRLGADVPFFLTRLSYALGSQRGDKIRKIAFKKRFWHLLIVAKIRVSTPKVYNRLDELRLRQSKLDKKDADNEPVSLASYQRLTNPRDDVKMLLRRLSEKAALAITGRLCNDLKEAALSLYPPLKKTEERLKRMGLDNLAMSGSGPTMFVFVSSRKEGMRLRRKLNRSRHWQTYLARTC